MKFNGLYAFALLLTIGLGCSENAPAPKAASSNSAAAGISSQKTSATQAATDTKASLPTPATDDMDFAPLSTTVASAGSDSATATAALANMPPEQKLKIIMEKLKPLQVMLGQWRGTTRRDYEGFKAVDSHEWIWDLQTDAKQPALKVSSDKSPFMTSARLTWNVDESKFILTATDSEKVTREYKGDYTDPVHEIVGPDDKLHRVFRMELTQTEDSLAGAGGEHWQVAFAQQENNRYLLEVSKRRGQAKFQRYDTVSTQREGTSFAISDTDYGDKTCIISQGLGTTEVSFQGKTYWVCCSGCKAAFEEDPALWIARAAKRAAEK